MVKLFDAPGPNPWVVRLALAAKGVDLAPITRRLGLVDGGPENRQPDMLALNSAGTTPFVMLSDSTILTESVATVSYLDRIGTGSRQGWDKIGAGSGHDDCKIIYASAQCVKNRIKHSRRRFRLTVRPTQSAPNDVELALVVWTTLQLLRLSHARAQDLQKGR